MFEMIKGLLKGVGTLTVLVLAAIILAVLIYIVWIILQIAATVGLAMASCMVIGWLIAMALFIAAGCCHE